MAERPTSTLWRYIVKVPANKPVRFYCVICKQRIRPWSGIKSAHTHFNRNAQCRIQRDLEELELLQLAENPLETVRGAREIPPAAEAQAPQLEQQPVGEVVPVNLPHAAAPQGRARRGAARRDPPPPAVQAAAPQGRARRGAGRQNPPQEARAAITPPRRPNAALRNQLQHGLQELQALGSPVINSDRGHLVLIANNCTIHNIHTNALQ